MEEKEDDEEKENAVYFYRILCLVVDLGTEVLRKLFLKEKPQGQTVEAFLKSKANELKNKKNKKNEKNKKSVSLYKTQLEEINAASDVSHFDITLLYIFISEVTDIPSRSPATGALLMKLKNVRNVAIAHAPESKMKKSDFEIYWNDTKDILIQLADEVGQAVKDYVKEEIDRIKMKPLGDMGNKLDILRLWKRQDQKLCEILSGVEEVNKKTDLGIKGIEDIKQMVTDQERTNKDLVKTLKDHISGTSSGTESSEINNTRPRKGLAELRTEIMDHYKENGCNTTAVPALLDGEEIDINKIFVMPSMRVRKNMTTGKESRNAMPDSDEVTQFTRKENEDVITTIHELFKKDGQPIRRVCISGDAGQGKTTLCKKIVSIWCENHSNIKNVPDTDRQFIQQFDLLFYLPLRNNKLSNVIEKIKLEIVRKTLHNALDEFLEKESDKCLIILDGLDEWLPPEECTDKVPYIEPKEKFTVLITSRPWKLEVQRPRAYEIGQEVELIWKDNVELIVAVVNCLNKKYAKEKNWKNFMYTSESHFRLNETYRKVKHLAELPIILVQMVCMWYDEEEFGNTRVKIYSKMVDYLFQVAKKRDQGIFVSTCMRQQRSTNNQLVNVFKDFEYCKMNIEILCKLSDLAYHTLFNKMKENSLVFPISDTKSKLTENDLTLCLKVGILSQTKILCKASKHTQGISFLHKTFQEFLAALYIADGSFKEMLGTLKYLDDVFEMSQVLIFLFGLRPDLFGEASHHIAQLTDEDDMVKQYRNAPISSLKYDIVKRIQNFMYKCIFEVPENRMLHYKFELRDVVDTMSLHLYKVEKMIPYLNLESVKSWDVSNENWTKLNGHDLVKLGVYIESQEDLNHLTSTVERCASSLTCLGVGFNNTNANSNYFLTALNKISHLTRISLSNVNLTHSDIEYLGTTLSQRTQLKTIALVVISCTTCQRGQCNLRIDLSHHKQLQDLTIETLEVDLVLNNEVPVEKCGFFSVKSAMSILDQLKSSTYLHELIVWDEGCHTNSITSSTTTVQDVDIPLHHTNSITSSTTTEQDDDIPLHHTNSIPSSTTTVQDDDIPLHHTNSITSSKTAEQDDDIPLHHTNSIPSSTTTVQDDDIPLHHTNSITSSKTTEQNDDIPLHHTNSITSSTTTEQDHDIPLHHTNSITSSTTTEQDDDIPLHLTNSITSSTTTEQDDDIPLHHTNSITSSTTTEQDNDIPPHHTNSITSSTTTEQDRDIPLHHTNNITSSTTTEQDHDIPLHHTNSITSSKTTEQDDDIPLHHTNSITSSTTTEQDHVIPLHHTNSITSSTTTEQDGDIPLHHTESITSSSTIEQDDDMLLHQTSGITSYSTTVQDAIPLHHTSGITSSTTTVQDDDIPLHHTNSITSSTTTVQDDDIPLHHTESITSSTTIEQDDDMSLHHTSGITSFSTTVQDDAIPLHHTSGITSSTTTVQDDDIPLHHTIGITSSTTTVQDGDIPLHHTSGITSSTTTEQDDDTPLHHTNSITSSKITEQDDDIPLHHTNSISSSTTTVQDDDIPLHHTSDITSSTTTEHDDDIPLHHTNSIPSSTTTEQEDPLCLSKVVTDVILTLKNLRKLTLWCIDFNQDILRLSPEITRLKNVTIRHSTMTLQCLHGFVDSLPQTKFDVWMQHISICPKDDTSTALKYITDRHKINSSFYDDSDNNSFTDSHQLTTEIPIGMTKYGRLYFYFTNRPSH